MLIEKIDKYLITRKEPKRPNKCFHPSSLHKTPKELYYHYLDGEKQHFPAKIKRIFDNGHAVHTRLQNYLTDTKILYATEIPVSNEEYEICGHADGAFLDNNEDILLEVKSINATNFFSLHSNGPKPEHLIQSNVYMFCLGFKKACLLYECKDDQELKEFITQLDSHILIPILTKIKYVQYHIKLGIEPSNNVVF